jgi:HSP20 family molecular chaperone IbpA
MSNQENEEFKLVQYKKRNNKFIKNVENEKENKEIQNLHRRIYSPKVDLIERGNSYFIRIELPGVEKSSIKINVKDDQIVFISGKKQYDEILKTDKVIYKESKYNDFTRRVKLPNCIIYDSNDQLDFKDGILKIYFTKKETNESLENKVVNFEDLEKGVSWADI